MISRQTPAIGTIKERALLTKPGSTKCTYHIALGVQGVPLQFNVGDSLGIYPQNDPILVEHILHALRASAEVPIIDPKTKRQLTLKDFLTHKANLSRLTSSFLKLFYEHNPSSAIGALLQKENRESLLQYLQAHDPLDLFKEYARRDVPLQELCSAFSPLLPRFYSVASSQRMFNDEVHLVVALFTYMRSGEKRYGVASHFLNFLAQERETPIPFFVQPAHQFFLTQDDSAPIIMIGPGAGVAPFRAFLQERLARGASGKNWLFFGERHRSTDFFYRDFFEDLAAQNKLVLDATFSRDQPEKIYVQHRMRTRAKELWTWLQEGAYLYVCGDAAFMAKDVDATLHAIAQEQGNLTQEQASAYFKELRKEQRYMRDVY